jgi:hypothetical protein
MSGVPLETFWAFNERWHNKFYCKVASCWLFLLSHTTMHGSMNIKYKINNYSLHVALLYMLGNLFSSALRCTSQTSQSLLQLYMPCWPHHVYGTAECCKYANPDVTLEVTMTTRVWLTHTKRAILYVRQLHWQLTKYNDSRVANNYVWNILTKLY